MRVIAVVGALVCALVVPTLASAGGWASVGFEPLPDGTDAGGTWKATIFVKQHGITPLEGLQPVVTDRGDGLRRVDEVPRGGRRRARRLPRGRGVSVRR